MKFLFVFAHPDDETVSCAETLYQLSKHGHQCSVVSVTDGAAGEVADAAQNDLKKAGSVAQLRAQEFDRACKLLRVHDHRILGYADGALTNQLVWGELQQQLINLIDELNPDVVVTFEHSGWYYHLDHVGVSIATTWAFHHAQWRTPLLLLSQMPFSIPRWQYIFSEKVPVDYAVRVADPSLKIKAMQAHKSQSMQSVVNYIQQFKDHREWFQVGFANEAADQVLAPVPFFQKQTSAVQRVHL